MKDPVAVTEQKVIEEVTGAAPNAAYQPALVRLYGVPINEIAAESFGHRPAANASPFAVTVAATGRFIVAAIYGYSYEGHCYSLPKPCLLVVDGAGAAAEGCGYNALTTPTTNYQMWTADRLDRSMMLCVEQGYIEELILQQSIGGAKTPAAYGTKVQLAHRGGKLNDT